MKMKYDETFFMLNTSNYSVSVVTIARFYLQRL